MYVIEVLTENGWLIQSVSERRDRAIRKWEDAMIEGYKAVRLVYAEKTDAPQRPKLGVKR